jgi:Competence protein CoiA-like family
VLSIEGDRRADVLVTSPDGQRSYAIEVQHSSLDIGQLENRVRGYLAANVAVAWILVANLDKIAPQRLLGSNIVRVLQYAAPAWQKWVYEFHDDMWVYDADSRQIWRALFWNHYRWKNPQDYWRDGEEHSSGGYWYSSDRWRDMYLQGPFEISDLRIKPVKRAAQVIMGCSLDEGRGFELILDGAQKDWPLRRVKVDHQTEHGYSGYYHYVDEMLVDDKWFEPAVQPWSVANEGKIVADVDL